MYGLQPAGSNHVAPKVFDLFMAGYELDMMEIRLQTLAEVVDGFVIVESRMAFRGQLKHLAVPSLYHQLPGEIISKLHYLVFDKLEGVGAWDREHDQRGRMKTVGLKQLGGELRTGDIVIFADCDNIPKPWFVYAMKHCEGVLFPALMSSQKQYYSFDRVYFNASKPQDGPYAARFNSSNVNTTKYANSAWHCSYCFDKVALMHQKLASYSHKEHDTEVNRDVPTIVDHVRKGLSIHRGQGLDLPDGKPVFIKATIADIPDYVTKNPSRFNYLLNRDVVDAGFKDLHMFTHYSEGLGSVGPSPSPQSTA
jgi:beta-1,4-mannosyl-glycoprotein beta-1,4-N-acetylglucosaminyltransferase